MRLSVDEVRKQHDGIKKLYEQGLRGATASVEQVLDLFDTIEALQQEIENLKATLADWKYNAKCDADHIAALTIEKDELVEELQKLEKSDASKEQCIIDQHGEIHRLRDELKRYKQAIERITGLTHEAAEKVIPTCNVTKLPCAGCNPVCEHRGGLKNEGKRIN